MSWSFPEQVLFILHPLKVRHRDSARIAQDVRDHECALLLQNSVSRGSQWSVGRLGDDPRTHCRSISAWSVFSRAAGIRMSQSRASRSAGAISSLSGNPSTCRKSLHVDQFRYIEAIAVVDATCGIADCDDFGASFMKQLSCDGACVAKSLHGDGGALRWNVQVLTGALDCVEIPRPVASFRPSDPPRLMGFL